ncbi:MAG: ATP-binding cassette domain-containing protein [Armatimonadia bacterium]|nr:ATP-binding cassette domain-containing protein [Armatimonadia bacterium]
MNSGASLKRQWRGSTMAADLAVSVRDLHKTYGRVEALLGLDLDVPRGAFYALLGRNGAGKTTTFDCITGLLGRDRGIVTLLGEQVGLEPSPDTKARVAYVGGHILLYDWMSLSDHLDFIAGFYPTWDDTRCERLLRYFKLPMDQTVGSLSPGMHLQFQLVMALSRHPELLIVDEPGNLDAVVRRRLMSTMIEILEAEDATILMASHLISELEGVCDHMCIIDEGRALVQGPVDVLTENVREVHLSGGAAAVIEGGDGVLAVEEIGPDLRVVLADFSEERAEQIARDAGAGTWEAARLSLEDFFIALTEEREAGE